MTPGSVSNFDVETAAHTQVYCTEKYFYCVFPHGVLQTDLLWRMNRKQGEFDLTSLISLLVPKQQQAGEGQSSKHDG